MKTDLLLVLIVVINISDYGRCCLRGGGLVDGDPLGLGLGGDPQDPGSGGPEGYIDDYDNYEYPSEESEGEGGPTDGSKKGAGGPSGDATEVPGPGLCSNVISRLLGPDVSFSPHDPSLYFEQNGGPVVVEGELDCDVDNNCCWKNAEAPTDKLEFNVGAGVVDKNALQQNFGTSTPPDGKFMMVASPCGEDPTFEAQFLSCSIVCTDEDVVVSLNHWSTPDIQLQVCARSSFFNDPEDNPLLNCADLPRERSPGPSQVKLPPGEVFDVVIVVRNFASGGLVMIDNIRVDYLLCPGDPTPAPGPDPACAAIECDFEKNNICKYEAESAKSRKRFYWSKDGPAPDLAGDVIHVFKPLSGRFKNYVTGIYKPAQGQYYTGVYIKKGTFAIMKTKYSLNERRVIRAKYYEATAGHEMQGCCLVGGTPNCVSLSTKIGDSLKHREWHAGQFDCPAGTEEVIFKCEAVESNHQGACGIDDITLHVYDKALYNQNDPENPLPRVCPPTKKRRRLV